MQYRKIYVGKERSTMNAPVIACMLTVMHSTSPFFYRMNLTMNILTQQSIIKPLHCLTYRLSLFLGTASTSEHNDYDWNGTNQINRVVVKGHISKRIIFWRIKTFDFPKL